MYCSSQSHLVMQTFKHILKVLHIFFFFLLQLNFWALPCFHWMVVTKGYGGGFESFPCRRNFLELRNSWAGWSRLWIDSSYSKSLNQELIWGWLLLMCDLNIIIEFLSRELLEELITLELANDIFTFFVVLFIADPTRAAYQSWWRKKETNASSDLRDSKAKLQIYLLYKCVKEIKTGNSFGTISDYNLLA